MKVGYARTSTIEQEAGLEAQKRDLKEAGCDEIFEEHASAVRKRDRLDEALNFVRAGDIFIVCKLDRLARSVGDLNKIIEHLNRKKVGLKILNIGLDTNTPTGKMMLTMLAAVAEFEREIMLERQREGIEKAKKEGKFKGRKAMPDEIKRAIMDFASTNVSKVWIAKKLNIGIASVYRVINENKVKEVV
jgi:DNA invertase Pin-like site-specific DNA recombinase